MLVVNLFAGPGAGKSTTAAGVFYLLKLAGYNAEYVEEEAKQLTWEDRSTTLECQPYVFAKQMRNLWRLRNKAEVVVTDSPILLSLVYGDKKKWPESFFNYVLDQFNTFDNLNFFIQRNKAYNPIGRNQNETEARFIDLEVEMHLEKNNVGYRRILGNHDAAQIIAEIVKIKLPART